MTAPSSFVLLNAGTETRTTFQGGAGEAPLRSYRSKELLLHISQNGSITFLNMGKPIDFHDAYVFLRLRADDAHFCGMLTEYFLARHIPFNDPIHHSYPESAEKISQMLLLALAGIPVPESFIFRNESFTQNEEYLMNALSFPFVFKTDGSQGRNVSLVNSRDELDALLAKKKPNKLALIQPFIENTFDTRTIVAFGEILGTISRTRTSGFLNNIAQGAVPARYELTPKEKDVALRAALACRIDLAGVDMIHTPDGPVVLEVNKSPQIKGFESVHGFKVFTKVAEIIRKQTGMEPV